MGRYAAICATLGAVLLGMAACGGGTPVLQPPPGIGEDVIIPQDIQAEYSQLEANPPDHIVQRDFSILTLNERRALGLYDFATRSFVDTTSFELFSSVGSKDTSLRAAQELAKRFGALEVGNRKSELYADGEWFEFWGFSIRFEPGLTRGELAWYADWAMQHCGDDFLIADPGPDVSLAGL